MLLEQLLYSFKVVSYIAIYVSYQIICYHATSIIQ